MSAGASRASALADDTGDINKQIDAVYKAHKGGTVWLEPRVYRLEGPIVGRDNVKIKGAFCGAHLFDTAVTSGTILRWEGAENNPVVFHSPGNGSPRIDNCGMSNLTIDGGGTAGTGLMCLSAYYPVYKRIHIVNVRFGAFYFGTLPTDEVAQNYHACLVGLTACLTGSANGIVLDGTPGSGRNTCFLSARNCHITFQNGVAYALSNCDDCGFLDCAASRSNGGRGAGLYLGGSSDGSGKAAYANRLIGWKSNAPIAAAGGSSPSRGNYILTNAVDGLPLIYQSSGATLTVYCYDGETALDGFARNRLVNG